MPAPTGVRYLSGAVAGACLTAIVVWVVDQLRRASIGAADDPTGAPASPSAPPPPTPAVGDE